MHFPVAPRCTTTNKMTIAGEIVVHVWRDTHNGTRGTIARASCAFSATIYTDFSKR